MRLLALVMCMLMAGSASANWMKITSPGGGYGGGGPFALYQSFLGNNSDQVLQPYDVFCLERPETIAPGTWYKYTESQNAIDGGASGGPIDPLDTKSKQLYLMYLGGLLNSGTLAGYDLGDVAERNELVQRAIWGWEGELVGQPGLATFLTAVEGGLVSFSSSVLADVVVWNPYIGNEQKQSMINYKGSLSSVPEPATFALFGMGALAAGFYRARRGSKKA